MEKTVLKDIIRFEISKMPFDLSLFDFDHIEPYEDIIWGVFTNSKGVVKTICLKDAWTNEIKMPIKYMTIDGQIRSTDEGEYAWQR